MWVALAFAGCSAAHDVEAEADAAIGPGDAALGDAAVIGTCDSPGGIGSPCSADGDCAVHADFSPAFCLPPARGASAGSCSSICMIDSECGPCGRCMASTTGESPAPSWYGLCVRACDPGARCRDGYVCAAIEAGRLGCVPDCRSQPGFCSGARCDAMTGSCVLGCVADSDCSDGSHCDAGHCRCGPSTACMPGGTCGPAGACGCAADSSCGPGHACDAMSRCCLWGAGLCS